jgi:uncharacterized protein YkwD
MKISDVILNRNMKNPFFICLLWAIGCNIVFSSARNQRPISDNRFNKKILEYINEMRRDPKSFYDKYLEDYIRQKKSRFTDKYIRSLKKTMYESPSLPLFETNSQLEKTALLQMNYLARYGGNKLTHEQGSISFADRMKNAGLHCLAENLYATDNPDALEVVLDLLIDQNVPSLGHRHNLMNPVYTRIGLVNKTFPEGRTLVVMDFGCKK